MSKITSQAEDSLGFTYPGNRATNFLQLTDTPDDYTGKGGKAVTVKTDESGLEFTTGTGGVSASAFIELTDVPNTYSGAALKVVQVNSGATGLDFVTLGGGGDALTSNPLSQFAATTSAQLRSVLSDETGTGAAYFAGGNAGTPSAINLANGTALPITAIVSSTTTSLGFGSIELGHANDTTISRLSAGIAAVEGNAILTAPNISDVAYDASTWNGDSTHAPSKNAVRDAIEALSLTGNDANGNYSADNFLHGVDAITAAAGITTLSVASAYEQRVTGSTTHSVKLPVVSTLALGTTFLVRNLSTGAVTILSSGGSTVTTLTQDTAASVSSNATTGTTASVWDVISNAALLSSTAISDTAYDATTWNGDTTHAPSKNAVRDKIEALLLSGGGDALTANPLSQFAATSSAQLKGVISDETGSGSVVFATSPTLVTPDIGVPTAGTLTSCTGLPVSTGVSGLGSGVAATLALNNNSVGGYSPNNGIATFANKIIDNSTNTLLVHTASYATNTTLASTECYGSVIYVTAAATISLPAIVAGMQVTVIVIGGITVNIDPNGSEVLRLDGTALSAGFKAYNPLGASGDLITLTYYSAGVWYAASNGWSDAGS